MLLVRPKNHTAFRDIMDAHHRLYTTHEAKGAIPAHWGLDDAMVRRGSILVQWEHLWGIIYDDNFPHTRRTIKNRHDTEDYEWQIVST